MTRLVLPVVAIACMAAAPQQRAFVMSVPTSPSLGLAPAPVTGPAPIGTLQPAPTPNREVEAPFGEAAGTKPSVSPTLINRRDTYRGEGFSRGSSPSEEQDKRVKPGAGFNLRMPFTPN